MGPDPKPTARQQRASKAQRAAAREAARTTSVPLDPNQLDTRQCTQVVHRPVASEPDRIHRHLVDLLTLYDNGVLKICPTENCLTCYYYWRWSRGPWQGHYVCVLGSAYDVGSALETLQEKIQAVLDGKKRPTKDRYS